MSVSGQRQTPTPSTSSSTAPLSGPTDGIKVNKPDEYHGDRNSLEDWLTQLEMYFVFYSMQGSQKTLFAVSYLRGRAQHWMKSFIKKYMDKDKDEGRIFTNFGNFKRAIRKVFGISNENATAERLIQHLQQKTLAADYAARFQEYAPLTEWNDDALITMFKRRLKDNVKDKLMRDGRTYEILTEIIEIAIDLDDRLYERAMEKRYDGGPTNNAGRYSGRPFGGHNSRKPRGSGESYYGPMPMELDATQQRKGKNPRGNKGNKNPKTCYNCGKPGHFARECRSKVQRRQLNATLKKVPDDWEEVSREDTDSRDSDPLGTSSDEEFQFIENVEALQEATEDNASLKTQAGLLGRTDVRSAFNQTPIPEDGQQAIAARPRTPYPEETSYQQRWDEEANAITDILEEQLGSNASEDKVIPIPMLRRLNATIGTEHNSLSWTACYDDNCKVHESEKDGAGWYPREPRRRAPKAAEINYSNTCRCPGHDTLSVYPTKLRGRDCQITRTTGTDTRHTLLRSVSYHATSTSRRTILARTHG